MRSTQKLMAALTALLPMALTAAGQSSILPPTMRTDPGPARPISRDNARSSVIDLDAQAHARRPGQVLVGDPLPSFDALESDESSALAEAPSDIPQPDLEPQLITEDPAASPQIASGSDAGAIALSDAGRATAENFQIVRVETGDQPSPRQPIEHDLRPESAVLDDRGLALSPSSPLHQDPCTDHELPAQPTEDHVAIVADRPDQLALAKRREAEIEEMRRLLAAEPEPAPLSEEFAPVAVADLPADPQSRIVPTDPASAITQPDLSPSISEPESLNLAAVSESTSASTEAATQSDCDDELEFAPIMVSSSPESPVTSDLSSAAQSSPSALSSSSAVSVPSGAVTRSHSAETELHSLEPVHQADSSPAADSFSVIADPSVPTQLVREPVIDLTQSLPRSIPSAPSHNIVPINPTPIQLPSEPLPVMADVEPTPSVSTQESAAIIPDDVDPVLDTQPSLDTQASLEAPTAHPAVSGAFQSGESPAIAHDVDEPAASDSIEPQPIVQPSAPASEPQLDPQVVTQLPSSLPSADPEPTRSPRIEPYSIQLPSTPVPSAPAESAALTEPASISTDQHQVTELPVDSSLPQPAQLAQVLPSNIPEIPSTPAAMLDQIPEPVAVLDPLPEPSQADVSTNWMPMSAKVRVVSIDGGASANAQWRVADGPRGSRTGWMPLHPGDEVTGAIEIRTGVNTSVVLSVEEIASIRVDRLSHVLLTKAVPSVGQPAAGVALTRGRVRVARLNPSESAQAIARIETPDRVIQTQTDLGVEYNAFTGTRRDQH